MAGWLAVTLTFAVITPIYLLIRLWRAGTGWAVLGLVLTLSPVTYGVFTSGGADWEKLLLMVAGIVVLSADLAGKLGSSN